ncbi:glutathione transferase GstA [Halomonas elongata]|uniref:glutathione transferase GstA n=1 Tax=Halomonas elongata TaxID=2746 RepID=UPI0033569540
MKLYYAPGTCSLSPHIVAREAGIELELEKVDIKAKPKRTESGADFTQINPKGYVPALQLDDGTLLTEGAAMILLLAEYAPEHDLVPPVGVMARYQLQEWLIFISSELHKMFSPWLFHPEYGEKAQLVAREKINERFVLLDRTLENRDFLMGEHFTVADAYCFAVVRWSATKDIDLSPYPWLKAYMQRVASRPKVKEALSAEGLETSPFF